MEYRHQDHGGKAAGKADIIEVHAALHTEGPQGKRRDHKAYQHPQKKAQDRVIGVVLGEADEADQGAQGGGHEPCVDAGGIGDSPGLGGKKGAQDDGPDVEKILPEKGESGNEPQGGQGAAVPIAPRQAKDGQGGEDHQGGVHQGRPHASQGNIVGNEDALGGEDGEKPFPDVGGSIQQKGKKDQKGAVTQAQGKNIFA